MTLRLQKERMHQHLLTSLEVALALATAVPDQ
jgi:aspartate carbamoyltransferase catalytic subunit